MTDFRPTLPASALEEGKLHGVRLAGREVLLVRTGNEIHATSNICPHAGSPLSNGRLVGSAVRCPLHGVRFRLGDGAVVGRAICEPLDIYQVRVRDGVVEVAFPD